MYEEKTVALDDKCMTRAWISSNEQHKLLIKRIKTQNKLLITITTEIDVLQNKGKQAYKKLKSIMPQSK